MKIAYVLGRFPVLSETFIGEEIRAMQARGHEIFSIALHRPDAEFQPADAALAEACLYFSELTRKQAMAAIKPYWGRLPRILPFLLSQTTEPIFPLLAHAAQLAGYMQERGCTHIHAHFAWGAATYAIAAAKLLKLPVTFTCHGSDVYARPLDLALKCKNANAVFCASPTLTADVQKIAGRTPCHTLYCGVDTGRFNPSGGEKNGRWLFTGRLMDCKGIEDILGAWALLTPEARPRLDIVGDGPLREKLMAFITTHGLEKQVALLGAKPSAWISQHGPSYTAFISAFRQGSDGSRDTAPMALKEAMAMGLPIVTTDFRDISAITGAECALLCPAASPDALARAVSQMVALSPDALYIKGMAGRKRVEQYYSLGAQAEAMSRILAV